MLSTTYISVLQTLEAHATGRAGEVDQVSIKTNAKDAEGVDLAPLVRVVLDWEAFVAAFGGQTGEHVRNVTGSNSVKWFATVGGISYEAVQPIEPTSPVVPMSP